MRDSKGFNLLKIIFSFSLILFSLSCSNLLTNNNTSCVIQLGSSIQSDIARSSSFPSDTIFKIEGLLYKKDQIALKQEAESSLDNLKDVLFFFTDIPFGNDYKIKVNLYSANELLYTVESNTLVLTEDNANINLDLSINPVAKNITYNLNGGTFLVNYPSKYSITSDVILVSPYRDDAEFLGWYLEEDFSGKKIERLNKDNFYGDVTLNASWRIYDTLPPVKFTHNNLSVSNSSYDIDYKDELSLSTSDGSSTIYYTTDGTVPSIKNGTLYTTPIVIDKNQTIKARNIKEGFISSPVTSLALNIKTYTVTFNNGGRGTLNTPSISKLKKGDTLPSSSLTPLTTEGYTFNSWQDSDKNVVDDRYTVTKDTTVTALWDINHYKISYVTGIAQSINEKTVEYNYTLTSQDLRTDLTKEKNSFDGWYIDTLLISEGYTVKNNITLTAKWTPWEEISPITITPSTTSVDYGDKVRLSTTTPGVSIYYTTDGTDPKTSSTRSLFSSDITITNDLNLRAIAQKDKMIDSLEATKNYTMKLYSVTFDNGTLGTTPPKQTNLHRGSAVQEPSALTAVDSGFEFSNKWYTSKQYTTAWNFASDTIDKSDITLYAKWNDIEPNGVSNFTSTLNSNRSKILLSWTNPKDKDLESVEINSTEAGVSKKIVSVNTQIGKQSTVEIPLPTSNLDKGSYTFTIKTIDKGTNSCIASNIMSTTIKLPKISDFSVPNARLNKTYTVYVNGINFKSPAVQLSDFKVIAKGSKITPQSIKINSDTELQFTLNSSSAVSDTISVGCIGSSTKEGAFEIKADYAIADVVMTDDTILTKEKIATYCGKAKPIAIIFSIKTGATPAKGVGLFAKDCIWSTSEMNLEAIGNSQDTDGSNNWSQVQSADPTGTQNAAVNYPAFHFANTYGQTYLSGTSYSSGWYLPSIKELFAMASITDYDSIKDPLASRFPEKGVKYFGYGTNLYSSNQKDAAYVWTYWYPHGSNFTESKSKTNPVGDTMSATAVHTFN